MNNSVLGSGGQFLVSPCLEQGPRPTPLPPWSGNAQTRAGALRMLQRQLTASQWFPPEEIERFQGRKIVSLLTHAAAHSPYYKRLLGTVSPASVRNPLDYLHEMPLLRREMLQSHYGEICAN